MKFNWGTGILIFLILFLSACTVFIVFAIRQDVNLVHEDYYEKGADYSEQMDIDERSVQYKDAVNTRMEKNGLMVDIEASLARSIDSGNLLMFRPSSSSLDYSMSFSQPDSLLEVSRSILFPGRYILKLNWFTNGTEYEIDKTVFIQ